MENILSNLLPEGYDFKIQEITSQKEGSFKFVIRMREMSPEELHKWRMDFQIKSCSNWIVRDTTPEPTRSQFVKYFVCHHSGFNKRIDRKNEIRNKNTFCAAKMSTKVKLITKDTKKKDVFVRDGYPTIVEVFWCRNHSLSSADAMSYLTMAIDIKDKFIGFFNSGMSVRQAVNCYRLELELQENFSDCVLANAALFPKDDACWRLYNDWRKTTLGDRGQLALKKLEEKLPMLKESGVKIVYTESPSAIVIITGLMLRAHKLPSSSEIVFVDSTSCCYNDNSILTFFLCATSVGAVPLAVLITNGQSETDYTHGFSLVKQLLGEEGFNRNDGPAIFMTDDSAAEKNALGKVWPNSERYLCQFHVAQAVWRWLWDSSHGIKKEDRKELIDGFRKIMYAINEASALFVYEEIQQLPLCKKYEKFAKYISCWWGRKDEWTLANRMQNSNFRGHNTNNFSESAVRIFKDVVLSRCKAYNSVALVDFICSSFEDHYKSRLRNFAYGRITKQQHLLSSLLQKTDYISSASEIIQQSNNFFKVPSAASEEFYEVDTSIGLCTCTDGAGGKFCKHQAAVLKYFNVIMPNQPHVTASDRYLAASLALGDSVPSAEFFVSLREEQLPIEKQAVIVSDNNDSSHHNSLPDDENIRKVNLDKSMQQHSVNHQDSLIERKEKLFSMFNDRFNSYGDDSNVSEGLDKLLKRLEKTKSASAFASFLHSSNNIPLRFHAGAQIGTQPTSRSRRKIGVTRGAKRLPSGRPSSICQPVKKRNRALSQNINMNQPNAKSHGRGL